MSGTHLSQVVIRILHGVHVRYHIFRILTCQVIQVLQRLLEMLHVRYHIYASCYNKNTPWCTSMVYMSGTHRL